MVARPPFTILIWPQNSIRQPSLYVDPSGQLLEIYLSTSPVPLPQRVEESPFLLIVALQWCVYAVISEGFCLDSPNVGMACTFRSRFDQGRGIHPET